jgi:hypothetical protein
MQEPAESPSEDIAATAPPRQQYTSQGEIPPPMPFPTTASAAPSASDRAFGDQLGSRAIDTADAGLDVAAAEKYNREHVVDVVRFDRATHGKFARGDGQLDAVRIAEWQRKHGLDATGCADENSCLVAEGKPPLPPNRSKYVGPPAVSTPGAPGGLTYAYGYRVPLHVRLLGEQGAAHVKIEVDNLPMNEVDVTIGSDGLLDLDLPIDTELGPGSHHVKVTAQIGGQTVETYTSYIKEMTGLGMPGQLGNPQLPQPGTAREPINQANAEQFNRDNVRNVVRFDRATRGYFAKPNGELDALAVAEWQTQHQLARTGMVDENTASTAEKEHGGLLPALDPDDPKLDHWPPGCEIRTQSNLLSLRPNEPIAFDVQTRPSTPVELDWAVMTSFGVGESERQVVVSDATGRATFISRINRSPPQYAKESGELQVEVSTPLGAAPLQKEQVGLEPDPRSRQF